MEHLAFSEGRKRTYGRPFTVFQHITLSLVLFTTYSARQVLSTSDRPNATYVHEHAYNSTVWDENVQKTQGKCELFHSNRLPELFYYWPEDSDLVRHCCITEEVYDNRRRDQVFKYSEYGEQLIYAIYRDVGYFDRCLPFWRCRETYRKIIQTKIYFAYCETTDLTSLYWNRFWSSLVWKHSLLQTLLPWIPILEVVVVALAIAVFPFTWHEHAGESPAKASGWQDLVPTWRIWLKSTWKRVLLDWGHLYLLAMVGNGLIEAMRRQDIYTMQTKLFFMYSTLYLVLFVIVSAASAMQQLAYWIGSATEPRVLNYWVEKKNEGSPRPMNVPLPSIGHSRASGIASLGKHTPKVSFASENDHPFSPSNVTAVLTPRSKATHHGGSSAVHNLESQAESDRQEEKAILQDGSGESVSRVLKQFVCCCLFPKNIKLKKISRSFRKYLSVHVFTMDNDYKWQPVATQGAILFAIASFLTAPVGDKEEGAQLFGSLLGYLVQAGCLWSGIYAVFVFFHRAAYILEFFMKRRNGGADLESQGRNAGDARILEFRGPHQLHSKVPVRP